MVTLGELASLLEAELFEVATACAGRGRTVKKAAGNDTTRRPGRHGRGGAGVFADTACSADAAAASDARPSAGDEIGATLAGATQASVIDVVHDSRQVAPGALFACWRGAEADGHDFADDAVEAGALGLLVERPLDVAAPQLIVESVRRAVGPAAAAVYGHPCRRMQTVAVTGTDGKSTTASMIARLLHDEDSAVTVVGTLSGARTTPEAADLQRRLRRGADQGAVAAVVEVSSHALAQHRVEGCEFELAVFTNLGRDHLDYHGSMQDYFAAKARLFNRALTERAVVNVKSAHGRRMAERARSEALEVVEVGEGAYSVLAQDAGGSVLRWRGLELRVPLVGDFNAENAVLAAEAAVALGVAPRVVAERLAGMPQVSGRFETIECGQDFTVVVDFAHTPEGLTSISCN